jgi:hypothetical protein
VAAHIVKLFKQNKDYGAWFRFYNTDREQWQAEGKSLRSYYVQEENFQRLNDITDVSLDGIISEENPKIRAEHGEMVKQVISSMFRILAGKNPTLSALAK